MWILNQNKEVILNINNAVSIECTFNIGYCIMAIHVLAAD